VHLDEARLLDDNVVIFHNIRHGIVVAGFSREIW
jgi:hypothetical protein